MGEYIPESLPRSQSGPPRKTRVLDKMLERMASASSGFQTAVQRAPGRAVAALSGAANRAVDFADEALGGGMEGAPNPADVTGGASTMPIEAYIPRGITPEGQRAGMRVSGQGGEPMPGVTGGASSTAIPSKGAPANGLRERFGFSFSSPGHVVSDAERAGTMFADGRKTEFAMGGPVQFNEDDARRPGQVAQQTYGREQEELAMKRRTADLLHAKQLADAQAMMGFTAKYGVPYDPETAKYVSEAERQMAEDDDFDAVVDALDAKRIQGYFMDPDDYASYASMSPEQQAEARAKSDRNYQKAIQEASLQWGVRRGGVDLKALKPEQALDSLLGQ